MSRAACCAVALGLVCGTSGASRAGGLDFDMLSPRSVGRAGVSMVSEDGGAALLRNPAGMVRRLTQRVQAAIILSDAKASFQAPDPASPRIDGRGEATADPLLFAGGALGELALGGAVLTTGHQRAALPQPSFNLPVDEVSRLYPHRYAGLSAAYRRLSFVIGAALRTSDWLGVGASVEFAQVEFAESRHVWAGFEGRDGLANPARDLLLTVEGEDGFVPGATAGLLMAPPDLPLELGLAVSYRMDAELDGRARLTTTRSEGGAIPDSLAGRARRTAVSPIECRVGLRYLGAHHALEVGAEFGLALGNRAAASWTLSGVRVTDETGQSARLLAVPAVGEDSTWYRAGASAERELIDGFMWVTAGYAYHAAATTAARISPARVELGRHTLAVGIEAQWADTTVSVGYARTAARARRVADSAIDMVSVFGGGPTSVGNGTYDAGADTIGILAELAWE